MELPPIDWELAARLTLYQALFVHLLAHQAAAAADGKEQLQQFGEACTKFVAESARFPRRLSADEAQEWRLHAKLVADRLFAAAEVKRQEFVQVPPL
jgi:hypothetical protein